MKSVMLSIQPKWCELIASGQKTIEVRKTRPQLETPFKCYIYKTKAKGLFVNCGRRREQIGGKVIGEFVCDRIYFGSYQYAVNQCRDRRDCIHDGSCLSLEQIFSYLGYKNGYGWHISDLKIYDTPKELSEFRNLQGQTIKRPFQSWGYVCSNE